MIKELCRLCGNKNDDMVNIFSELSVEQKINFKVKEVLRINILKDDILPNVVCLFCIKHLENAYYFINYCYQTQNYLIELCQKNSTKDCSMVDCGLSDSYNEPKSFNSVSQDSSHLKSIYDKRNNDFNKSSSRLTGLLNLEDTQSSEAFNKDFSYSKNDSSESMSQKLSAYLVHEPVVTMNFSEVNSNDKFNDIMIESNVNSTIASNFKFPSEFNNNSREKNQNEEDCRSQIRTYSANTTMRNKTEDNRKEIIHEINNDKNEYDTDDTYELSNDNNDSDYECTTRDKKKNSKKNQLKSVCKKNSSKNFKGKSHKKSDGNKTSLKISKEIKERKRLSCATCKMTFTQELTYQEHLNVHTGNRPFSCKLCEASFRKRQELNQHLRTIHSEKQFKCPLCDHIAKHKGKLTEHMKSVHEKPFACDLCNYRTGEKGKIMQHIANKHTGDLSYVCEICGNGFKTKTSLQTHRQNIHFPEPKVCQTCGTVCPSLARYSAHIFRCGKEKKRYPCEKCGKTYVNKEILKDHMNKHLNIKPYKCDVCGKDFFQRNRLDTHKYVHRGAAYRCEICNQSFNRKDNMKNHMKKHFYKSMRYDNMIVTAV